MGCIRICVLVYAHAFLCEFVLVCVRVGQTPGSRLEIKTLCGTGLMIGLELKQKEEEHTEKREERRGKR